MKRGIPKELSELLNDVQSTSKEIICDISKLQDKAKASVREAILGLEGKEKESRRKEKLHRRKELRTKTDQVIHSSYYKDGGYRFWAKELVHYVNVVMPEQTEVEDVWVGGYNGCIATIKYKYDDDILNNEIWSVIEKSGYELRELELENLELLFKMQEFVKRAYADRLNETKDWDLKEYKEKFQEYATDLEEQLLKCYCPPS